MLVIKRALSFTLSFALAFSPTLAFAKSKPKAHHPRFEAESTAQYNKQVDAQEKKRAAHKRVAVSTSNDPLLDMGFKTVQVKGKTFQVYKTPGVKGRSRVQITRGENYQEILVDEYGTGTASRWEVTRGDTKFVALNPYRGAFQNIEIEQKRAGAIVKSRLTLNTDWKTYRISGVKVEPYTLQGDDEGYFKDNTTIGDLKAQTCAVQDQVSHTQDFLKKLTAASDKSVESTLACQMNRYKDFFIDPSCSTGKFAKDDDSADEIAEALAKVFATSPGDTKPPLRYLACLNEHKFAYHAAKMQSEIHDYVTKNMLAHVNLPLEVNNCSPLKDPAITSYFTADSPRMFTCEMPTGPKGEQTKDISDYRNDKTNQIIFNANSKKTLKKMQSVTPGLTSASDAYAMLITHEMLHQSGIKSEDNEALVQDLEHCCADPTSPNKTSEAACGRVDEYTYNQKFRQDKENELSHYWPGYDEMRASAETVMSTTSGLNGATDKFMAQSFSDLLRDREVGNEFDALKECDDKKDADKVACQQAFEKSVGPRVRQVLQKNCKVIDNDVKSMNVNCGDLASTMLQQFSDGAKNQVQVTLPKNTTTTVMSMIGNREFTSVFNSAPTNISVGLVPAAAPTAKLDMPLTDIPSIPPLASTKSTRGTKTAATGSSTRVATAPTPNETANANLQQLQAMASRQKGANGTQAGVADSTRTGTTANSGSTTNSGTNAGSNTNTGTGTNSGSNTGDDPSVASTTGGVLNDGKQGDTPATTDGQNGDANSVAGVGAGTQVGLTSGSYTSTSSKTQLSGLHDTSKAMSSFGQNAQPMVGGVRNDSLNTMDGANAAVAVSKMASSVGDGIANAVVSTASKLGLQSTVAMAQAPQRAPASTTLTQAQANAGYRNSRGSSKSDSDDSPAPKAQAGAQGSGNDKDEPASPAPVADLKVQAAAEQKFLDRNFGSSTELVAGLKDLGGITGIQGLAAQLQTSGVQRKLRANNVVVIFKGQTPYLKDTKNNRCYTTDPNPRTVIRLVSPKLCG